MQGEKSNGGGDANLLRAGRNGRGEGPALGQVAVIEEVVLGQPDRWGAQALGFGDSLQPQAVVTVPWAVPLGRIAHVYVHAYLHHCHLLSPLIVLYPRLCPAVELYGVQ
jgi:hypothetical protein